MHAYRANLQYRTTRSISGEFEALHNIITYYNKLRHTMHYQKYSIGWWKKHCEMKRNTLSHVQRIARAHTLRSDVAVTSASVHRDAGGVSYVIL